MWQRQRDDVCVRVEAKDVLRDQRELRLAYALFVCAPLSCASICLGFAVERASVVIYSVHSVLGDYVCVLLYVYCTALFGVSCVSFTVYRVCCHSRTEAVVKVVYAALRIVYCIVQ